MVEIPHFNIKEEYVLSWQGVFCVEGGELYLIQMINIQIEGVVITPPPPWNQQDYTAKVTRNLPTSLTIEFKLCTKY